MTTTSSTCGTHQERAPRRCGVPLRLSTCIVSLSLCLPAPSALAQAANQIPASSAQEIPGAARASIGPGDLIDVQIYNTPELSARLRVDQQGRVLLPLSGAVPVAGLTASSAAAAIADKLRSTQIMLAPAVSVTVLEYAGGGVTVLGEVRSPGIYPLTGSHTLYDALASAGGNTSSAGSNITISHKGDAEHPLLIDVTSPNYSALQKSTVVEPGDTVFVSRAELVYIVGDVQRSGAFYLQSGQHLTVLNLLSLAQGTNRTAAMSHTSIIRPTPNGGALTIPFNLNKVMKNQEPNLVLQAGDVLVVPRSGWKTFSETALPGVTNAVSGAASTALIVR